MHPLDQAYKDKIGRSITLKLIEALENNIVSLDESREIATYIDENIDNPKTSHELLLFLEEIARKWTFFGPLLVSTKLEEDEERSQQAAEKAQQLLRENRIDEAIQTTESLQNTNQKGEVN